jgi:hypothetical protein
LFDHYYPNFQHSANNWQLKLFRVIISQDYVKMNL